MSQLQTAFDVHRVRADFPILGGQMNGHPLCYLDNAATAQKPRVVTEAMTRFYSTANANIHRGVYALSQAATEAFEEARAEVARFIGADAREVVFTRGATEAINLVAASLAASSLRAGDRIVLTEMEHHANLVPWQLLRDRIGVELAFVRVDEQGELDMEDLALQLEQGAALLAMVYASNSLGTLNPVSSCIELARSRGIPVLIDASQALPHLPVDVGELDCDWLVFSGHKVFGPTGIGVLYGKFERLEQMPPYQGGGDMIDSVAFERVTFKAPPARFEAGTPPIAAAIGLAAAVRYLRDLPQEALLRWEATLLDYATAELSAVPGLRIIGTASHKVPVVSFIMDQAHPHDIASVVDAAGVAIRAGHHCTQPLMAKFGLAGTARASFAFYNLKDEVDTLVRALGRVRDLFG